MQRFFAVLLFTVLLFALASCGTKPEPKHPSTKSEKTSTTESAAAITAPPTLDTRRHDLRGGVSWQLKRETYEPESTFRPKSDEFPLANGKVVFSRRPAKEFWYDEDSPSTMQEIVLRERDGKEIILLRGSGDRFNDQGIAEPILDAVLDDRYILFYWIGGEWIRGYGIYDTQELQEYYPISPPIHKLIAQDGDDLYFGYDINNWGDCPLQLLCVDWRSVERAKTPVPIDLLEATPEINHDGEWLAGYALSPDFRWFVASTTEGLLLYKIDCADVSFWQIPYPENTQHPSEGWPHLDGVAFIDAHTIYWYGWELPYIVEVHINQ